MIDTLPDMCPKIPTAKLVLGIIPTVLLDTRKYILGGGRASELYAEAKLWGGSYELEERVGFLCI